MGHPVLFQLHQGLHGLDEVLHGDLGDAHAVGGILHPLGVALRTEELNGIVHGTIGLHALKKLLGIVEHHGGGVHGEGGVGDDAGVVPALPVGIVHQEHVVCENLGEAQLALIGGLGHGGGVFRDFDIQHGKHSPVFCIGGRPPAGRGASRVRFCALNDYMLARGQSQWVFRGPPPGNETGRGHPPPLPVLFPQAGFPHSMPRFRASRFSGTSFAFLPVNISAIMVSMVSCFSAPVAAM